jgi:diguanylate cyclase
MPLRVLIIDGLMDDAETLIRELRRGGYELRSERVDSAVAMQAALGRQAWDLVLSDYEVPEFSAIAALEILQRAGLDLPFIIVAGTVGEETAVQAMRAGAHDFIFKGHLARLLPAIERELREAASRRERRAAEETIRYLAYYDALTDIPNRTLFQDRLHQSILAARREEKPLALLVMDLDRFKDVNDTMGHQAGDLLLQQVGIRLQGALRASDTVGRLGGDEFAVLLPGAGEEGASRTCTKLHQALDRPFIVEGQSLTVGASIGVALFPDHGDDGESLLRRADVAMYVAKSGSSGFAVYSPDQDANAAGRLALTSDLRRAINHNELVLHYQPKVRYGGQRAVCVEALVRWDHPSQGLMAPEHFIPVAEQTGLITPLSRWVLNAALCQCHEWRARGFDVEVAVNLSMRNLHDPALPDQIAELLHQWSVPASSLIVEATESTIMANPTRAMGIVTRLRDMGVRISIDDFGTGYSSLAYLKRFPVDELKVDRSFVMDMHTDDNDAAIVRATIDLAHNLGLRVVAEGVENRTTLELLRELGCDSAQGYLLSRPVPADDFLNWLADSPWSPLNDSDERSGDGPSLEPVLERRQSLSLMRQRVAERIGASPIPALETSADQIGVPRDPVHS